MLSSLTSLPLRSCTPGAVRLSPPGSHEPCAFGDEVLISPTARCGEVPASPPDAAALAQSSLWTSLAAGVKAGWSNAAMCPTCVWNGGCLKELGHSGAHVCAQGHRWGA